MADYHERFVAHAKKHLDPQTFDRLHLAARGAAGGAAPRRKREDESYGSVKEELSGPTVHGDSAPEGPEPAAGGAVPVTKNSPGAMSALTAMWAATVRALTGTDLVTKSAVSGPVHTDVPLGSESAPPKRPKPGTKLGTKQGTKVPPGEEETETTGDKVSKVVKSKWRGLAEAIAERDGLPQCEGVVVQLGLDGDKRMPGALAFDVGAHDDATLPHDLGLGVPLPDGVADVVYISKSAAARPYVNLDLLLAEAQRISAPGAELVTDFALPTPERRAQEAGIEAVGVIEKIQKRANRKPEIPLAQRLANASDERKELVLKSLNAQTSIAGINRHKRLIYAPVLVPDEVHDSLDYLSPEDIEHSAHGYMQNGHLMSSEHSEDAINADVVESFIAPCDLHFDGSESPYGAQTIPKGSWVVGAKIHDDAEWQKVLRGEYTGFSTGGYGTRGEFEFL